MLNIVNLSRNINVVVSDIIVDVQRRDEDESIIVTGSHLQLIINKRNSTNLC